MEWVELVIKELPAIVAIITLIYNLIKYIKKSIKEKNYKKILTLVMNLMEEAEEKFDDGATRKEWVLSMVEVSVETIDYDINMSEVEELINSLCSMSKKVNTK